MAFVENTLENVTWTPYTGLVLQLFPKIRHYFHGQKLSETFKSYLSDETWKNEDPLAWYLQPNGFCMSAVSYLFTFSSQMQLFHEYLTQEQGVNTYAAYGLYFRTYPGTAEVNGYNVRTEITFEIQ